MAPMLRANQLGGLSLRQELEMAELSPLDTELLSKDLPELAQVAVESRVYAGGRGLMEYRAAGERGNPAMLMLHGLGSSSAGYRAQFAGLFRDFHVIAWNAPGFGDSSQIGRDDACIDDFADALEAFLRALGLKRLTVLVGSSWGSIIALAFARRYPQLVGSLVLSAPNVAKGHLYGEARDTELDSWLRTADISLPVSRAAIADRLLAPDTSPCVRRPAERLRDVMTTEGWRQAIRSLFTIHTPDVIQDVRCPIAILAGALDRVAPYEDHAWHLLAAAPWAKSHLFEGCGHLLKLEAPSKFNSIVRQVVVEHQTTGESLSQFKFHNIRALKGD
jgi:pimeloyl-ACP methyl ester carboxylesterase